MFSKISQFSKDVFTEVTENGGGIRRPGVRSESPMDSSNATRELKNGSQLLATQTPDVAEMTQPQDEEDSSKEDTEITESEKTVDGESSPPVAVVELPADIKSKLKKFAKYEDKYPRLLDAYKIEKKKSDLIGNFEKLLKEFTPVSTISDADLLIEYLKGLTSKTDMLNEELRRMSGESAAAAKVKVANEDNIKQLEIQVNLLKKENEDSKVISKTLAEKAKTAEELQTSLEKTNERLQELERDSAENQSESLDDANKEIAELKAKLGVKEEHNDSELQSKLDEVSNNLSISKIMFAELEKDHFVCEEKNNELEATLEEQNEIAEELKSKISSLISSEEELQKSISSITSEKVELEKQVKILEEKDKQNEYSLVILQDASKEDQQKLVILNQEKEKLQLEAKDLQARIEEMTTQQLNSKDIPDESAADAVQTHIASSPVVGTSTASNKKKNKKKKKKGTNATTGATVENVKETETLQDDEDKEVPQVDNEALEQLRTNLQQLQQSLDSEISKNQSLNEKIESMEGFKEKLEQISAEFESLQKQYTEANRSLKSKSEEIDNLKDMLRDIGNDLVSSRDELKQIKDISDKEEDSNKLKETEDKVKSLSDELEKIKGLKSELDADKEKLTQELDEREVSLKEKSAQLTSLENQLRDVQTKYDEKTAQFKKLEDEHDTVKKELTSKFDVAAKDLVATKDLGKSTFKENSELKQSNEKLSGRIELLTKEIDTLNEEKEALNKKIENLSQYKSNDTSLKLDIASLRTSIQHKDKLIADYAGTIDDLNKTKDKLTETISNLRVSNSEISGNYKSTLSEKNTLVTKQEIAHNDIKNLNKEINKLNQEKQAVVNELEEIKNRYSESIRAKSDSTDVAQVFKQQCDELTMKSKEAIVRIETLEDELGEARTLLQERTRESSTMRQLLLDTEEQLNGKVSSFQKEISRINDEKMELENTTNLLIKKKQREIEEAKALNDSVQDQLGQLERSHDILKQRLNQLKNESTTNSNINEGTTSSNGDSNSYNDAIAKLREQLVSSTKTIREMESNNSVLKKLNEETSLKYERMTKNYKLVSQQYKALRSPMSKSSSTDSVAGLSAVKEKDETSAPGPNNNPNIAYVKNVLLGYLEHKEQRNQLLPVVKTLLQLDKEDETRLLSALNH